MILYFEDMDYLPEPEQGHHDFSAFIKDMNQVLSQLQRVHADTRFSCEMIRVPSAPTVLAFVRRHEPIASSGGDMTRAVKTQVVFVNTTPQNLIAFNSEMIEAVAEKYCGRVLLPDARRAVLQSTKFFTQAFALPSNLLEDPSYGKLPSDFYYDPSGRQVDRLPKSRFSPMFFGQAQIGNAQTQSAATS